MLRSTDNLTKSVSDVKNKIKEKLKKTGSETKEENNRYFI